MIIFSRLWEVAFDSGLRASGTPSDMLWYLASTEWIVLSIPGIHTKIEDDVRDGSLAYQLGRPVSYIVMRLAEASGQLLVRLIGIGIGGFLIAFLAAGVGPNIGDYFLVFVVLGLGAAVVGLLFQAAIGLCALWLQEATPLYWVWHKFLFLFGGLMLPLTVYPEWMQEVSSYTPFFAILYSPSRLMISFDWALAIQAAMLISIWGFFAVLLLFYMVRKSEQTLVIGGG
jgi:ABC-2 type transport system permease protein